MFRLEILLALAVVVAVSIALFSLTREERRALFAWALAPVAAYCERHLVFWATRETDYVTGTWPQPTPHGSEVVHVRASLAAFAQADNDMLAMCLLPAGCVPVEAVIINDDLDAGGPDLVMDFGIFNADGDAISTDTADGGDEWIDGGTFAQSAAVTRMTTGPMYKVTPTTSDRTVGFKVMTDSATDPSAANKLILDFSYRAAYQGA